MAAKTSARLHTVDRAQRFHPQDKSFTLSGTTLCTLLAHLVALRAVFGSTTLWCFGCFIMTALPLLAAMVMQPTMDIHKVVKHAIDLSPRTCVVAWLGTGCLSPVQLERLLAGVFLCGVPGAPRWLTMACLAVWLLHFTALSQPPDPPAIVETTAGSHIWVPCLVFMVGFTTDMRQPTFGVPGDDEVANNWPEWTSPSRREVKMAWRQTFGLGDKLLGVHICTVAVTLMHQGWLYISSDHVCFQGLANLRHIVHFTLRIDNIKEVRVGRGSEPTVLVLRRALHMEGQKQHMSQVSLYGCEHGTATLAEMVKRRGVDLALQSGGTTAALEPGSTTAAGQVPAPNPDHPLAKAPGFDEGEPFAKILESRADRLSVKSVVDELLGDWPEDSFFPEYLRAQGATDVCAEPWLVIEDGGPEKKGRIVKSRRVTMTLPVPAAPLCPSRSRTSVDHKFIVEPQEDGNVTLELQTAGVSHDVPFGESIIVQSRLVLTPDRGGANLVKSNRVTILTSLGMLKSRVLSCSEAVEVRIGDLFLSMIRNRFISEAEAAEPEESGFNSLRQDVFVWELQRRSTIFSSNWAAPFLPHDGQKAWRWVDSSYLKHPWLNSEDREAVGKSDVPPLEPREGWKAIRGRDWEVSSDWQYSLDFATDKRMWGNIEFPFHVRRRLWVRTFQGPSQAVAAQ